MHQLIRIITFICIVFAAFVVQAKAQACGNYFIQVSVQDEAGMPIADATVNLSAITKDETRGKNFVRDAKDPLLHVIDYPEGYSFSAFHKVTVSAPGFKTTENEVIFQSCDSRNVLINLAAVASEASSVWRFENSVNVRIVDSDGKNINGVTLTVKNAKGKQEDVLIKLGDIFFRLANGEYTFRFQALGYGTKELKVNLSRLASKSIKLELQQSVKKQDK